MPRLYFTGCCVGTASPGGSEPPPGPGGGSACSGATDGDSPVDVKLFISPDPGGAPYTLARVDSSPQWFIEFSGFDVARYTIACSSGKWQFVYTLNGDPQVAFYLSGGTATSPVGASGTNGSMAVSVGALPAINVTSVTTTGHIHFVWTFDAPVTVNADVSQGFDVGNIADGFQSPNSIVQASANSFTAIYSSGAVIPSDYTWSTSSGDPIAGVDEWFQIAPSSGSIT